MTVTTPSTRSAASCDLTLWPLAVFTLPPTALTDEALEALIANLQGILRRRDKHLVLMDCLAVEHSANARQRARLAMFLQEPEARSLSSFKIADVVLLRSAIVRGAITAIFWVSPPASPIKLCGDGDEALPFIRQRFREEGLTLTAAMEARIARMGRSLG
jgi:hypothetical protein